MGVFPSLSYKFESYFFSMNKRLEISVEFNEEGEKKKEKRGKGRKIANSRAFFLSFKKTRVSGR